MNERGKRQPGTYGSRPSASRGQAGGGDDGRADARRNSPHHQIAPLLEDGPEAGA